MSETTKTCTMCKRDLPLGDFYRDRRKRDGLYSECKACVASRRKADRPKIRQAEGARREANREHERARVNGWQRANRERTRERQRQYRESHREEINARARERYRARKGQQGGT